MSKAHTAMPKGNICLKSPMKSAIAVFHLNKKPLSEQDAPGILKIPYGTLDRLGRLIAYHGLLKAYSNGAFYLNGEQIKKFAFIEDGSEHYVEATVPAIMDWFMTDAPGTDIFKKFEVINL